VSCLIVFCSLTQAQNAAAILRRNGISTVMVKPPTSLGRGSCAHGLLLESSCLQMAAELLKKISKKPIGIYEKSNDNIWKELLL
jgi:hypothetical protein